MIPSLSALFNKALAFFMRDFRIETRYKLAYFGQFASGIYPIILLHFFSKMVPSSSELALGHSTGYFSFALIGLAFTQYFLSAMNLFEDTIRRHQTSGCLEALLNTRTSPELVIILSPIYSFAMKSLNLVFCVGVSCGFFGLDLSRANYFSAFFVMVLSVLCFVSVGILAAAFILHFKKGGFIEVILGSLTVLFSGAFFPKATLPPWMQVIGEFLPITYAIRSLRCALLDGAGITGQFPDLIIMVLFIVVLFPLSIMLFSVTVSRGRRNGSLLKY